MVYRHTTALVCLHSYSHCSVLRLHYTPPPLYLLTSLFPDELSVSNDSCLLPSQPLALSAKHLPTPQGREPHKLHLRDPLGAPQGSRWGSKLRGSKISGYRGQLWNFVIVAV